MDPFQNTISLTPPENDGDEGFLSSDLTTFWGFDDVNPLSYFGSVLDWHPLDPLFLDPIGLGDVNHWDLNSSTDSNLPPDLQFPYNPDNSIVSMCPSNQAHSLSLWGVWDPDLASSPLSSSSSATQASLFSWPAPMSMPTPRVDEPCLAQYSTQQLSPMPSYPVPVATGLALLTDELFLTALPTQEPQVPSIHEPPRHQPTPRRLTRRGDIPKREVRRMKRPEKCRVCGKGYQYQGDLKKHIEAKHTPDDKRTRHSCLETGCGRSYARKDHLARHQIQKHGRVSNKGKRTNRA